MRLIKLVSAVVSLLIYVPVAVNAASDDFPQHSIRLVTAFNGGISDTIAHTFSSSFSKALGQSVIVTTRSGGAGNVGVESTATAVPDGYTLLLGGGWLYTNHLLQPTAYNDPDRSLTAVAPIVSVPYVWVANPRCDCHDLKGLVQRIKATAQPVSYGSPGIGTPPHLLVEAFSRDIGKPLLHVPYRGGGPLTVAILSGEVTFSLISLPTALPYIQRGNLIALAATSPTRSPLLPTVPTVREEGFADQEVTTWFGLFAPAKLPDPVRRRLVQATNDALAQTAPRTTFSSLGASGFSPREIDAFPKLLSDERNRWQSLVAPLAAGVNPSR
ncbi:tripartite-type tricarboxylate transporter receptor subunit TctC [Paraburkholderia sp. JPY465]|uniref:Bug family tripartite tricarboxylate transporter substrate binding protein n=1 Tax=Paraburkholderia sp. JPY465 TaxID=3042285 RepID=UPI003D1E4296